MNFQKEYLTILILLASILNFDCGNTNNQSREKMSYVNKTSVQISLSNDSEKKSFKKDFIIELKNKSRSFNYFGVTDSSGIVIFKEIFDGDYDLFVSGTLKQSITVKKDENLKISVKI